MMASAAQHTSRAHHLADPDAKPWVIAQLERAVQANPAISSLHDALVREIVVMASDFEAVFPQTSPRSHVTPTTSSYLHSFANEMIGNLFITPSGGLEEGLLKIGLARQAARMYLDGGQNPSGFIGYPVLKILVRYTAAEAETWISCLQQRSEKVRSVPENILDCLVDDADSPQSLGELIDSYALKASTDLSSFRISRGD